MPGLDRKRLLDLKATIESDIADDRYFGAVIAVARHGEIGLAEAIGHGDEAKTIPLKQDSVFSLFSLTKAFTNVLVFRAIELGQFALTTRISEIIPEFKASNFPRGIGRGLNRIAQIVRSGPAVHRLRRTCLPL